MSYISAKKKGKSRRVFDSMLKKLKSPPSTSTSKSMVESSPSTSTPKLIQDQLYDECIDKSKDKEDAICRRIKTEMAMDITNRLQEQSEEYIIFLYRQFLRRYIRYLEFKNATKTQYEYGGFVNFEGCNLIVDEQFRNFINFDLSIASIMRRYEYFVETDMEAIEEIVDKQGKSRLDKLYQLLFNQVLINTGPYYEYMIQMLHYHEKMKNNFIKVIKHSQDKLKTDINIMKNLERGETVGLPITSMVHTYLMRMNINNKKITDSKSKITKEGINLIKQIIEQYNKYCDNFIITEIFEEILEINNEDQLIERFKDMLKDFDKLYEEQLNKINDDYNKYIFEQFLGEFGEYYDKAIEDILIPLKPKISPELFPPEYPTKSVFKKPKPKTEREKQLSTSTASTSVMSNSNAIDFLMKLYFNK